MGKHIRQQVREAVVAKLAGLTTTGTNIFTGRVRPLTEAEMPGWLVAINDEDATDGASNGGPTAERRGQLLLEGRAQGNDELQDLLDTMASEAEAGLFADDADLDGLVMSIGPPRTQIDLSDAAQGAARRTGMIRMLFLLLYRSRLDDPTTQV